MYMCVCGTDTYADTYIDIGTDTYVYIDIDAGNDTGMRARA